MISHCVICLSTAVPFSPWVDHEGLVAGHNVKTSVLDRSELDHRLAGFPDIEAYFMWDVLGYALEAQFHRASNMRFLFPSMTPNA